MIEVDLGDLGKAGQDVSQLLRDRLRAEVIVERTKLIVSEEAGGSRFGVKEVKTQVKHILHHLGLSDGYRVLAEHHKIRIVRVKEKPRPRAERKALPLHRHNLYPTSFPDRRS